MRTSGGQKPKFVGFDRGGIKTELARAAPSVDFVRPGLGLAPSAVGSTAGWSMGAFTAAYTSERTLTTATERAESSKSTVGIPEIAYSVPAPLTVPIRHRAAAGGCGQADVRESLQLRETADRLGCLLQLRMRQFPRVAETADAPVGLAAEY